ncbi:MAG: glycogen debranching enzyme family protein [Deltaproteobacteria bacterium]|nr:glycogen debranching enzyme family protein [Deltaproteobacteria bacterium]
MKRSEETRSMIVLSASQCADMEGALRKEWLETNGIGGYASSTIVECNTRRYHGLLVSNLPERGGRFVLLSTLEDSLILGEKEHFLTTHRYPDLFFPGDRSTLAAFTLDLQPRFTYRIGGVEIRKELLLLHGEDTLLIRYVIDGLRESARLKIRPFIAYRNIHELTFENDNLRRDEEAFEKGKITAPYYDMPALFVDIEGPGSMCSEPHWYLDFEYGEEERRGFPCREDLFTPGCLDVGPVAGDPLIICFSTLKKGRGLNEAWENEILRRKKELNSSPEEPMKDPSGVLRRSARHFITGTAGNRTSIIAGYHWFYEWGRDSLISLPGLTFHAGRIAEGVEILSGIAGLCRNGRVANTISEAKGDSSFNSVDATLWFFWCVQELMSVTGDLGLVRDRFWTVLCDMLTAYAVGGEHMKVMDNGLLDVGDASTQLTWMDATVGGIPVTPRHGCPVEINALWYNALCMMRGLALQYGMEIPGIDIERLCGKVKRSIQELFWIPSERYLADVWLPGEKRRDGSIRPNQIFAVSLPHSALDPEQRRAVVKIVTERLLTPCGLRTLDPADPRYCGEYRGGPEERDRAYHQGTVWPWLLGHYGEALLSVSDDHDTVRNTLMPVLQYLEEHLLHAGLGHISEVFDGEPPHRPGGCIAQAWSTAEVIRLTALLNKRGVLRHFGRNTDG